MHKKASLSLSINAIVILILAITMLGLGLAFMRNIFGSATQEFSEVSGTVKKQMIDQMKESDKIVDLSRPKVKIKSGESTQVFIGFKNDGSAPRYFRILNKVTDAASDGTPLGNTIACSLSKTAAGVDPDGETYLEYKLEPTTVLGGDVVVLPINIKTTSNVKPDTCFYELIVSHGTDTEALDNDETIELTVDIIS